MTDPKNRAERLESPLEPDAERLAALLDGRLDERQRAEAVGRLASSDDEFEAFVDALAVTRELEAADAAAGVTPLRPRARQPWWQRPGGHWAAVAAVLVGLALLPVLWSRSGGPDAEDPARFAAQLSPAGSGLPAGWNPSPWGTTRGPGDPLTPEARAVRLGALLTDLEVVVKAQDTAAARVAARIGGLLEGVRGGALAAAPYRELSGRAGEPPERLAPLLEEGREGVAAAVADVEYLELGAWAEAGRIAARRRDAEFFRSRVSRDALDGAAELTVGNRAAGAAVERVRAAGVDDWDALEGGFTELLKVLGS